MIRIGHTSTYNWDCIGVRRATTATCENWTCECTKHGGSTLGRNQMPKRHGVQKEPSIVHHVIPQISSQ
jgi:hypothetical protein